LIRSSDKEGLIVECRGGAFEDEFLIAPGVDLEGASLGDKDICATRGEGGGAGGQGALPGEGAADAGGVAPRHEEPAVGSPLQPADLGGAEVDRGGSAGAQVVQHHVVRGREHERADRVRGHGSHRALVAEQAQGLLVVLGVAQVDRVARAADDLLPHPVHIPHRQLVLQVDHPVLVRVVKRQQDLALQVAHCQHLVHRAVAHPCALQPPHHAQSLFLHIIKWNL
jgi:hypothetical protein